MSDSHEADAAAMTRLRDGDDLALNELMTKSTSPTGVFVIGYAF